MESNHSQETEGLSSKNLEDSARDLLGYYISDRNEKHFRKIQKYQYSILPLHVKCIGFNCKFYVQ